MIEACVRLLELNFNQDRKNESLKIIQSIYEAAKNSEQEGKVLLTAANWCLKFGFYRKQLLFLYLSRNAL